jgi:hypothetical protein
MALTDSATAAFSAGVMIHESPKVIIAKTKNSQL